MVIRGTKIKILALLQIWANGKVDNQYQPHVKTLIWLDLIKDTAGYLSFTQKGDSVLNEIFQHLEQTELSINEVLEFKKL